MRSKLLSRLTLGLMAIIMAGTVTGVTASWNFAEGAPRGADTDFSVRFADFVWQGSDILPTDSDLGKNHQSLITKLVDGENIGLNYPNSDLNEYVKDRLNSRYGRDYFGSMAVTGGSTMDQLFGTKSNKLCFLIHFISNTEYHIFTTGVYLGEQGSQLLGFNTKDGKPSIPIGEWIYPIYRTVIKRANTSSKWEQVITQRGRARSDWYDENRSNANATEIPSFDPDTWQEITIGDEPTKEDAIWTFIGDERTATAVSATTPVFYQITPASAGTRRVVSYNTNVTFNVYNSGVSVIASTKTGTDGNGVPYVYAEWSATANTLYYIRCVGDKSMVFTVS